MVLVGLVAAWFFAASPTIFWPSAAHATYDGVILLPCSLGHTSTRPFFHTATQLYVVPRSMPTHVPLILGLSSLSLSSAPPRRHSAGIVLTLFLLARSLLSARPLWKKKSAYCLFLSRAHCRRACQGSPDAWIGSLLVHSMLGRGRKRRAAFFASFSNAFDDYVHSLTHSLATYQSMTNQSLPCGSFNHFLSRRLRASSWACSPATPKYGGGLQNTGKSSRLLLLLLLHIVNCLLPVRVCAVIKGRKLVDLVRK